MSDPFANCLYHTCSPTFRKVKPANLFTLHKERCPSWAQDLEECRRTLQRFGQATKNSAVFGRQSFKLLQFPGPECPAMCRRYLPATGTTL